jgi:hypothetical protein
MASPVGRALRPAPGRARRPAGLRTRGGSGAESGRIYRALGRGEYRAGRSLDALQAAYRVGARVAWRRVSRLAAAAEVPVEAQHELAEAIFAYIDQLAAESVEGYADAQAGEAGSRQRRREELLMLLLMHPPAAALALEEAATRAAWRVPRRVAMVAVSPAAAARVARRLSGDVLHASDANHGYVSIPEPGGASAELAAVAGRYEVPSAWARRFLLRTPRGRGDVRAIRGR